MLLAKRTSTGGTLRKKQVKLASRAPEGAVIQLVQNPARDSKTDVLPALVVECRRNSVHGRDGRHPVRQIAEGDSEFPGVDQQHIEFLPEQRLCFSPRDKLSAPRLGGPHPPGSAIAFEVLSAHQDIS